MWSVTIVRAPVDRAYQAIAYIPSSCSRTEEPCSLSTFRRATLSLERKRGWLQNPMDASHPSGSCATSAEREQRRPYLTTENPGSSMQPTVGTRFSCQHQ